MSSVIKAVYENGVFKPLQDVAMKEHEQVALKVVPLDDWQTRFNAIIDQIRQRTAGLSSEEIEADIRAAIQESRNERRGR